MVIYSVVRAPSDAGPAGPRSAQPIEREEDDCLDHGRQPFIMLTSSTAMEPRLR